MNKQIFAFKFSRRCEKSPKIEFISGHQRILLEVFAHPKPVHVHFGRFTLFFYIYSIWSDWNSRRRPLFSKNFSTISECNVHTCTLIGFDLSSAIYSPCSRIRFKVSSFRVSGRKFRKWLLRADKQFIYKFLNFVHRKMCAITMIEPTDMSLSQVEDVCVNGLKSNKQLKFGMFDGVVFVQAHNWLSLWVPFIRFTMNYEFRLEIFVKKIFLLRGDNRDAN